MSLSRRSFLRGAAALSGACAVGGSSPGGLASGTLARGAQDRAAAPPIFGRADRRTRHVVLVAFAGGVRTRETFGTPANVPNLVEMAAEGVLYPRARSANLGHFGAALSIFTGIAEQRGIRENARGEDPTLFEYVRKDLDLGAGQVWISTSGGPQQTNYSHGLHADYGRDYGASTLDGDGIFNAEFKQLLSRLGRPRDVGAGEQAALARMRAALARARGEPAADGGAPDFEQYLLDELSRGTAELRGPNSADAKAIRVARNLLVLFEPALVAIVLQQADVAHSSFNGYQEVIRQNDEALGSLWAAVKADAQLAQSTAIFVVPEFGRDRDLNERRGLDHGDGSEDISYVSALAWGPDFRRGAVVNEEVGVVDLCPTVCELAGARARLAKGRRLPKLYA